MNRYYIIFIIITTVMLLFSNSNLQSELDTTKNKEFILTFLPNYHNYWYDSDQRLSRGDSIYIFIYAEVPTKGKIEFRNRFGDEFVENFEISNPNVVYVFKRAARDFALLGFNVSGRLNNNTDVEKIENFTFKVSAEFPVQVYGHSQSTKSSESFNVLPIESLGNQYIVLAYNSNNDAGGGPDGRTPSQFAVVAVEDETIVDIIPSAPTYINGLNTQRITLNAGEVYLVQTSLSGGNIDLTGSEVLSNKPIAVFSGQQRARVPINSSGMNPSRDYLVEQMPPVDSWSNEAIVVPFPEPSSYELSTTQFDKFRVIAAYDNTELFVDGVILETLNSGEIYEADLRSPLHIKANAPIMAAGYKRSSQFNTNQFVTNYGDPLLQIIPTPNQFGEAYRFITIQTYENFQKVYNQHYITIIAQPDNIPSLQLNGNPVNPNLFRPIFGSDYRYAQIKMNDGTHNIRGDKAFGLFVCGYGDAVSYGYYCGVVSKRDDFEPPVLQASAECFDVDGLVSDKRLKSVTSPVNLQINTKVEVEQFTPYVTEAKFSASLINSYLDGKFRITAIDSIGQQTSSDYDIPGFTVALISEIPQDNRDLVKNLNDTMRIDDNRCYKYRIKNYGKFDQMIISADLINNNPELTTNLPKDFFYLSPGQEIEFEICFQSDTMVDIFDTLKIKNPCETRTLLTIHLQALKDENAPQVSSASDPCNQFIEIVITDSLKADLGIQDLIIEENENFDVEIRKISDKHYKLFANVKDPEQDSYLKLKVIDLEGNESIFEKAIPGYTIQFDFIDKIDDDNLLLDFGNRMIGVQYCDSVRLTNYGKYEIIINNPRLSENIKFSIPPSELPIILQSGELKELKVCFLADKSNIEVISDTMKLRFNCIEKNIILLGQPDSLIFDGDTKCDIPIVFEVAEVPEGAFVGEVYPNPSGGIVNFDFNNPTAQTVTISISNQIGSVVKNFEYPDLNPGYYNLPLDLSHLNNSSYNMRIKIGNSIFYKKIMLVK